VKKRGGGRGEKKKKERDTSFFKKKRAVWAALREIASGTSVSYGEIASRIGRRTPAARGLANGSNPIELLSHVTVLSEQTTH